MNSHLAIKINGQDMALKPDQTLDLEFQNPLFNDVDMFSLPFNPPFALNRKLLGNMDHPDSQLRATDMERQQAVVYGDGVPVTSGVTIIEDNSEMGEGLSMNIDASTRSFDDLIGDLECRDVPLKDRIQIGEKIGNVHIGVGYTYKITVKYEGKKGDKEYHWNSDKAEGDIEPQALGFSYPGICAVTGSKQVAITKTTKYYPKGHKVKVPREVNGYANSTFINVTDAYGENSAHWGPGGAKYCNARVCYKHYALNEDGTTSSEVVRAKDYNTIGEAMYEDHFPYWVLDADRPQSGICFYVLYFLDCLFAHLGVGFDKSALMAVEDLKHLCFFTTHCCYDIEPINDASHTFQNLQQVNAWLASRGCGGQLKYEQPETKSVQEFKYKKDTGDWETVKVGVDEVASISTEVISSSIYSFSAKVCKMWANSDNFPEESVKTILDSLQASFGIRFHYDYEKNKVTAYLLRDVFRQRDADGTPLSTMQFNGTVNSVTKLTEKITGFRMKYSAEGTAKEQEQYIRRGKRDYDTDFDYREYPEGRTIIDKTFEQIADTISSTNMNVYVDKTTGNAYRIKINSEATNTADMRPVLFEVGQFKGIEVGDCSKEAEEDDMVREYVSDFQPISFNDVNYSTRVGQSNSKEYKFVDGGHTYTFKQIVAGGQPLLCAYIDEDMEHEFVEQRINNPLTAVLVDMYLAEVLTLVESYDPTKTDDGNSPLQTYEWGLAVAMMRGGGTNMTVQNYDHNYDGFGNDRWRTVAGEYALTSDTMDQMGNEFDYNGQASGIGEGERFSLKIAAYKPFRYKYVGGQLKISTNPREWATDPEWLVPCDGDVTDPVTHEIETKIRTRGLYNTFMAELCYFLLNRKPVRIKATTTVAQLADIPNHWRQLWQIGNMVGFINKVKFQLSVERSLGEVTIDFYVI